jgi:hypothetical protein
VKYSAENVVGLAANKNSVWTYSFLTEVEGTIVDGTKNGLLLKSCN